MREDCFHIIYAFPSWVLRIVKSQPSHITGNLWNKWLSRSAMSTMIYKSLGSHNGGYVEYYLLEYNAV
jgi:hypothetical protein